MKVFGVIFKDGHKTYNFKGDDELKKDDYVIVETDKGLQYAKINAIYEDIDDFDSLKKLAVLLDFSIDNALGVEIENDNDDKIEWLIIGGFIIGNTLGIAFDNYMLGYVFAMIGLGLGFVLKAFKK